MTTRTAVGTPIFDALLDELRMTWQPTASMSSADDGVMTGVLPEERAKVGESAEEEESMLVAT